MEKKITLIAPPWYSLGKLSFLSHNLGLGYIAAYLESNGHKVHIIDAVAEGLNNSFPVPGYDGRIIQTGLSYQDIVNRVDPDTDFIGLTVPFTSFAKIAQELSHVIKKKFPEVPLVLGGVYPSTLPEHAILNCSADYVVRAEGEVPMLQLVEDSDPHQIKGLVFREEGKIIDNGIAPFIDNLDEIPFPARHLLPMEKYLCLSPRGRRRKRTASLITSRGCPFDCTFCSIHFVNGYKWRKRSPQTVLEEIKYLVDEYRIEHIEFEDDNLTLGKKRAETIFEGIINLNKTLNKKITFSCSNGIRVDTLDRDLIKKMKAAGFTDIQLAVESGDPTTLQLMKKNLDLNKVLEVVKICSELKIRVGAFMIVGYPGETKERFRRSLEFFLKLKKLGVSFFAIHIVMAYPKTKLWDYCKEKNYLVPSDPTHAHFLVSGAPRLKRRYVSVVTEDFSAEEVLRRRDYAHKKLNPTEYYLEKYGLDNLIGFAQFEKMLEIMRLGHEDMLEIMRLIWYRLR